MTSFIEKLRVVVVGHAHDLLDKSIDMDSPSALRQYTRELEDALDKLRSEAAIQAGQVRTLAREIGDLEIKANTETEVVTKILAGNAPNKTDLARTKGAIVVGWRKEIESKKVELENQRNTSAGIDSALAKLEIKHSQMVARVRELERLDRTTKAKEQSASAVEKATKIVSNGADISVDDIESKMKARNDVASEKFDRAMGSLQGDDSSNTADVDEFLASLQQPSGK